MKVRKALEDVWRWEDTVYQDTKDMASAELIAYLKGAAHRLEEKTGIKLDLPVARGKAAGRAGKRRH